MASAGSARSEQHRPAPPLRPAVIHVQPGPKGATGPSSARPIAPCGDQFGVGGQSRPEPPRLSRPERQLKPAVDQRSCKPLRAGPRQPAGCGARGSSAHGARNRKPRLKCTRLSRVSAVPVLGRSQQAVWIHQGRSQQPIKGRTWGPSPGPSAAAIKKGPPARAAAVRSPGATSSWPKRLAWTLQKSGPLKETGRAIRAPGCGLIEPTPPENGWSDSGRVHHRLPTLANGPLSIADGRGAG